MRVASSSVAATGQIEPRALYYLLNKATAEDRDCGCGVVGEIASACVECTLEGYAAVALGGTLIPSSLSLSTSCANVDA